ncbi:hypothetical protein B0H66DRAFT_388486 [Apodospora peruviana]|uniref:3'(2'),5'-bisphosphate nucleotidase n=1 Tax=Apodospora peruviana TaxID=516989 RepID=A0AAE0HUM7_9PEZI|nr:hypothetical protein B0H66DRAFT_388486 [Apodospora peruviana]
MTVKTISPPAKAYARERRIAERAVHRASILTKRAISLTPSYWASSPIASQPSSRKLSNGEISKSDASPVTAADFAAQALLISAIHGAFPADSFIGEEDADSLRRDPLLAIQVFDFVQQYSTVQLVSDDDDDDDKDEPLYTPTTIEEMFHIIDLGGRGTGGRTGRFWALDPIDGTATFVKGQQYAVSLALIEDGREVVGVLGCPNLKLPEGGGEIEETSVDDEGVGLLLSAVRGGQGSTYRPMGWEGSKLRPARKIEDLRRGLSAASTLTQDGHSNGYVRKTTLKDSGVVELGDLHFIDSTVSTATCSKKVRQLADAAGVAYPGTELYSSHMRYVALIFGGRGAVQVRVPNSRHSANCIWDHAGAQLIYTESGRGKVTDLNGKPVDFGTGRKLSGNYGIITADESVHGKVLELVRDMLDDSSSSSSSSTTSS